MKKTIVLMLVLAILSSANIAFATDIDLSGLNFDELVELKDKNQPCYLE